MLSGSSLSGLLIGGLLLFLSPQALAGPYDGCSVHAFLPWRPLPNGGTFDWSSSPRLNVWFSKGESTPDSSRLDFQVDTGSCGVIAGKDDVGFNSATESCPEAPAFQYLSSSKILYTGCWVWRWVWFNYSPTNPAKSVKAYLRVLALDQKLENCNHWTPSQGAACSGSTAASDPRTQLMGISWGRMYDGQPQGDPSKNPLLNIKYVQGDTIEKFCHGWKITNDGIDVGLTADIWGPPPDGPYGEQSPSRDVGLGEDPGAPAPVPPAPGTPPPPAPPAHHYAWGELPGCVQVQDLNPHTPPIGTQPCVEASVLLDSGMNPDHASIRLPKAQIDTTSRFSGSTQLKPNHVVTIKFGEKGTELTRLERYTNDNAPPASCDITPAFTNAYYDDPAHHSPARFPFANAGRHAYRRWTVAFDPRRGRARLDSHALGVACP